MNIVVTYDVATITTDMKGHGDSVATTDGVSRNLILAWVLTGQGSIPAG